MKFVSPIGVYGPILPYAQYCPILPLATCNPWLAHVGPTFANPLNSRKPQRGYAGTSDLFCSGHPGDAPSKTRASLKHLTRRPRFLVQLFFALISQCQTAVICCQHVSCEDQLLTQTFEEPLGQILELLPKERQTLFFSATITQCIQKLKKGKDLTFIAPGAKSRFT